MKLLSFVTLLICLLALRSSPTPASTPDPRDAAFFQAVRDRRPPAELAALLGQGAHVDARDVSGQTPLMWAAQGGNRSAVVFLLDHGADIHARSDAHTALELAVSDSQPEIVRLLLERGADVGPRSPPQATALLLASCGGQAATVKALIGRGANPNTHGLETGMTPLMWAAFSRSLPTFEALLRAGADPLARDSGGMSVLCWAVAWNNREMTSLLLARKADVNAGNKYGATPLTFAHHADLIRFLAAHGANVNARTDGGSTALMGAVLDCVEMKRDDGSVRALIALGADVNAQMDNDSTALSFALAYHLDAIAALLRKAGAKEPPKTAPLAPSP